jgi:hypothetical protein
VEYVDGVLAERNVGDYLHGLIQSNLIFALRKKYSSIKVIPDLTKIQNDRDPLSAPRCLRHVDTAKDQVPGGCRTYRSRDPFRGRQHERKMLEKLEEYAAKGVPNIWLIDPRLRRLSVYVEGNIELVKDDTISTCDGMELTRDEIFQQ